MASATASGGCVSPVIWRLGWGEGGERSRERRGKRGEEQRGEQRYEEYGSDNSGNEQRAE